MGKRAEQNKKRKRQGGLNGHSLKPVPTNGTGNINGTNGHRLDLDDADGPLVSQDDLDTTLLTLETLCEEPDELARKEVKDVKRAVYALQRVMAEGSTLGEPLLAFSRCPDGRRADEGLGTSLSSRISAALQDYRFTDALILLFEMHTRRLPPKLGSLQRWVRECDATVSASGETRDIDAMKCLDLILRIANPNLIAGSSSTETRVNGSAAAAAQPLPGDEMIRRKPTWTARGAVEGEIPIWDRMQNGRLFGESLISMP